MHLLLTRPRSETTAEKLRAAGHTVTAAPLMAFETVPWHAERPAAVMLTSPQGAHAAPATWQVPTYVVGSATAHAARAAGYQDVRTGTGTVQTLVNRIAADGFTTILHLAGQDRTRFTIPPGLTIETKTVYRARLLPLDAIPESDFVLLYSARTAAHFAAECTRLQAARAGISLAALSPAIAAAAGSGWHSIITAAAPNEDALLAAIDAACQKAGRND